ncbi:MAG TPA: alkaline phosphatase D family protein [Pseudonocardiaceae bacterium]|nr:alkaline phosphatase D family protein [Pseudonocardiaceae bacterium]
MARRDLLAGGVVLASAALGGCGAPARVPGEVFSLGVASGDPLPDSVVLWTRLAPEPLAGGGMPPRAVEVQWEIAEDEGFRRVVRRGTEWAVPELAHSVHAEPGGLRPGASYFYRFRAGDQISPVGRTRTGPDLGSSPGRLRLAFVSCQDWQGGYYSAYRGIAGEDLEFVLHLGDYIYEYAPRPGSPRQHDGPELDSLESYRNRHALYRTDPDLRAAHAAHPFVLTWDDHEVDNNYANDIPEDTTGPAQGSRAEFLNRRARAYQAYYEHLPLRRSQRPAGPSALLYRRLRFGDLAEFAVLDTRQYRTDQPCGDGMKPRCAAALDPAATMTGPVQERWLLEGLDRSGARWNVIAQQTMFAQYDFAAGPDAVFNLDQWDGYVAARARILGFLAQRRPPNPVVLSGDIHSSWVHDLKADFADPRSATVGTEFVGTSISSRFPASLSSSVTAALADNPHTRFFNGDLRGYIRCDADRQRWTSAFRVVDTVLTPGAATRTLAEFTVENGHPGAQRV